MRLPTPGPTYSQTDEAQTRRLIEQSLNKQGTSIPLGGGLLYENESTGALTFRGRLGTVTILAPA